MNGDHPFGWYQYFDGGRSFFTSLGHTKETYANDNFIKLIHGGIEWASGKLNKQNKSPLKEGLLLDLNADNDVQLSDGDKINAWVNQVKDNEVNTFVPQDKGRKIPGSGRPRLKLNVPELNGKILFW